MARRFFPQSPLGKRYRLGTSGEGEEIEVIGVVKDAKYESLGEELRPMAYYPYSQRNWYLGNFEVSFSGALGAIGPEARSAVKDLTAALADPIWEVRRQAPVSLGRIGPDARAAVPALQKATADKHSLVQKAAKEALKQIGA